MTEIGFGIGPTAVPRPGPHLGLPVGRHRIEPGGEWGWAIDGGAPLEVTLDGRVIAGFEGDTVASLLWAHGERRFLAGPGQGRPAAPRRFDLFDPDGWIWLAGEGLVQASACRVADGDLLAGLPVRPAAAGATVVPTARRGRLRSRVVAERRPLTSPTRPAEVIRMRRPEFSELSGRSGRARLRPGPARRVRTDVLVCGGGLAGLTAARAAADAGATVLLVEAEDHLGGACRWSGSGEDRALVEATASALTARAGVDVVVGATAAAVGEGRVLVVVQHDGVECCLEVEAASVVVATGVVDRLLPFEGNDLPGVMSATGAHRLLSLWAVRPGDRALVVFDRAERERAGALADRLRRAKVEVADLVELPDAGALAEGVTATGGMSLDRVGLSSGRSVEADVLVTICGVAVPTGLLSGFGGVVTRSAPGDAFRVAGLPSTVAVVGSLAGCHDVGRAVDQAEAAGRRVAGLALRHLPPGRALPPVPPVGLASSPPPSPRSRAGLVDAAIDLRAEQLDGFASSISAAVERLVSAARRPGLAVATRSLLADLSVTSSASAPVGDLVLAGTGPLPGPSLGALAGLDRLTAAPLRRSPLADLHDRGVPRIVEHDGWQDVWHHGDPRAEVDAVHHAVGLRDATAEGWFRVIGPAAAAVVDAVAGPASASRADGSAAGGDDRDRDRVASGRIRRNGPYVVTEVADDVRDVTAPVGGGGDLFDRLLAAVATFRPWAVLVAARNEDCARFRLVGPAAPALLETLGVEHRPGWSTAATVAGVAIEVADLEADGVELLVPAAAARAVWAALESAGVPFGLRPVGLAAAQDRSGRRDPAGMPA
jgi:sarcosine oxidase subunit alpha